MSHPVHWWPAQLPREHDGLLVIGVRLGAPELGPRLRGDDSTSPPGDERLRARAGIRAALRQAVAQLAGVPEENVAIRSEPGQPPAVSIRAGRASTAPGIAISHEAGLSLAAINLRGPVGIDLIRVQDIPDWQALARDYLGSGAAAMLAAIDPGHRAAALARGWTEREARLKCHGLQLAEWTANSHAQTAAYRCLPLALPDGFAGSVAFR